MHRLHEYVCAWAYCMCMHIHVYTSISVQLCMGVGSVCVIKLGTLGDLVKSCFLPRFTDRPLDGRKGRTYEKEVRGSDRDRERKAIRKKRIGERGSRSLDRDSSGRPDLKKEMYHQEIGDKFWLVGRNSNGEAVRENTG